MELLCTKVVNNTDMLNLILLAVDSIMEYVLSPNLSANEVYTDNVKESLLLLICIQ